MWCCRPLNQSSSGQRRHRSTAAIDKHIIALIQCPSVPSAPTLTGHFYTLKALLQPPHTTGRKDVVLAANSNLGRMVVFICYRVVRLRWVTLGSLLMILIYISFRVCLCCRWYAASLSYMQLSCLFFTKRLIIIPLKLQIPSHYFLFYLHSED